MGLKFRGTVFTQTISASKAQKIEHQQQQHQRVSAVLSPDGVFTISAFAVLLFPPLSANLHFHFCITLIFKKSTQQQKKKKPTATETETE